MMNYKEMVMSAKAAGVTNEKTMWESIESFSELLDEIKEAHPDVYWNFMRKQHGIMHRGHYDEMFALYDVGEMYYTDKQGVKRTGAHWTADQIEAATAGIKFPASVTKWDKYVAFNAAYADLAKVFDDGEILKAGHALYFADEDWGCDTKIWDMYEAKQKRGVA
jgi:hypothetical protein